MALTLFDKILPGRQRELSRVLDRAESLAADGNFRQAIDVATAANRTLEVPEIEFSELTAEVMGGAFQHHGSLLVRGLTTPEQAKKLQIGIDRAMKARELSKGGGPMQEISSWYVETPLDTATNAARGWLGGVWLADSPRMMYEFL